MNPLAIVFLLMPLSANANLFKCTDIKGHITYTNSPCTKVGLKENKVLPPPPPPAIDAPAKLTVQAKKEVEKEEPHSAKPQQTVALQVVKTIQSNSDACNRLNEEVGRTMDEMDAARTQGGSQKKQSGWNEQLKQLQAKKSQLGCF